MAEQYHAAYQGRPGAYSDAAARALVGPDAVLLPCATLEETFAVLTSGRAAHAVVPVENTLAGSVTKAYDLLLESEVTAVAEHIHHVDHALIGRPGATLDGIRRVLSHPVALAQCEQFFRVHPSIAAVPVFDTAGAVPLALDDPQGDAAAIASREAARLYGGAVILEHLQDHAENFTRFLMLTRGSRPSPVAGEMKTMLGLRLANRPGALWSALEPFALDAINLTKIESRPLAGRPFEYAFVVEFQHEAGDPRVGAALDALAARTTWWRLVGSFRAAQRR